MLNKRSSFRQTPLQSKDGLEQAQYTFSPPRQQPFSHYLTITPSQRRQQQPNPSEFLRTLRKHTDHLLRTQSTNPRTNSLPRHNAELSSTPDSRIHSKKSSPFKLRHRRPPGKLGLTRQMSELVRASSLILADPREHIPPYNLLVKASSKALSLQQPQRTRSVSTAVASSKRWRRGKSSKFELEAGEVCRPWSREKFGPEDDHMISHG